MAYMYVEEYADLATDQKGNVIGPSNLITAYRVAVAGTSTAAAAAFDDKTKYLIVETDTVCQFEVAATPVADSGSQYLSVNNRKLVPVTLHKASAPFKIACIAQQA